MPAPNTVRRRQLVDAAIELIARDGLHGLTHRALDRQAGVPAGTTSNYFATRDALLIAAMERVWELHHDDMERQSPAATHRRASLAHAVELITASLVEAATTHRHRYIAIYELQSEMRRRPELAAALVDIQNDSAAQTSAYHRARGLPIAPDAVPALEVLYGGALLGLLSKPVDQIDDSVARPLAQAMIYGARRRPPT